MGYSKIVYNDCVQKAWHTFQNILEQVSLWCESQHPEPLISLSSIQENTVWPSLGCLNGRHINIISLATLKALTCQRQFLTRPAEEQSTPLNITSWYDKLIHILSSLISSSLITHLHRIRFVSFRKLSHILEWLFLSYYAVHHSNQTIVFTCTKICAHGADATTSQAHDLWPITAGVQVWLPLLVEPCSV